MSEIHLHALFNAATQIHVPAAEFLREPSHFFETIEKHSVTFTFAPNFFVAAAVRSLERQKLFKCYDLSSLRHVVSGGEANVVATSIAFTNLIVSMGGARTALKTAFGMTETSAASHYHQNFPALEEQANIRFCSVGRVIKSIAQRITDDYGNVLTPGEDGNLELSGPGVFKRYHNNPEATKSSFTSDGWFKTGDKGYISHCGSLILGGRAKDSIIINGVKYFSHELESAIEESRISGVVASYVAAFATWTEGADSEELAIVFLPTTEILQDDKLFTETIASIGKVAFLYCSKKPVDIIPLTMDLLPKSALGKLSRPKLKVAYESGKYDKYRFSTRDRISRYREKSRVAPVNQTESTLIELFALQFGLNKEEVGMEDSLTDMGIDSIQLIQFKARVQETLHLQQEIPMISLLQNPSLRGISEILSNMERGTGEYQPVVQLQGDGSSTLTPLFFLHPGLGEILVFLNLSKYFSDRPVYAIRAPGFNPGEEMHKSVDDMTT